MFHWCDYWLNGIDSGALDDPAVRSWVTGRGERRSFLGRPSFVRRASVVRDADGAGESGHPSFTLGSLTPLCFTTRVSGLAAQDGAHQMMLPANLLATVGYECILREPLALILTVDGALISTGDQCFDDRAVVD